MPPPARLKFPDVWRQAAQWYWDAMWNWHITPNATYQAAELMQPSDFASGNLAMAITPLWYTCCLDNSIGNFTVERRPGSGVLRR